MKPLTIILAALALTACVDDQTEVPPTIHIDCTMAEQDLKVLTKHLLLLKNYPGAIGIPTRAQTIAEINAIDRQCGIFHGYPK